ncbi:MAG TPA: sialidase family protein [Thermoanaerobaculia bacterium]|nr:sialidase family protein [Thermoanaerobaculia bacterium]
MSGRRATVFLIGVLALAACRGERAAIETILSPAGAGAAEPFLSPAREGVLLSWLEPVEGTERHALRFARLRNGEWSSPITVAERDDFFVNWADFPSIVEDEKGVLFVHWLQKSGPKSYDYDIRMATSSDGGTSWDEPFLLNRDGRKAEHGFVSVAAVPGGGVGATWLDGRNMTGSDHDHGGGDMTLRYATVDAAGPVDEVELDPRVCECCATGMTMTAGGPVIVYRDRSDDEIRDISFVRRTTTGWSEPKPLRRDGWKIAACPVNGPQIDSAGSRVATAWFTAADETQRVYAAFSDDGGATFGEAVVVDEGKPAGRVDIVALDSGDAIVTWLEQTPSGAEIRLRRIGRDGIVTPSVKVADSSMARGSGFPRIARSGRDLYIAWTEQSTDSRRIHVARMPL